MNKKILTYSGLALVLLVAPAWSASVAIEDFEAPQLAKAPEEKDGWEAKGSDLSTASITRATDAKRGGGAGEISFDVKQGGWALVQKKVEGAAWLKRAPRSISFWLKGGGSGKVELELEESYTFKWRKEIPLTNKEWQLVTVKLSEFTSADKTDMSAPDIVAVKFVSTGGAQKFMVDDLQIETAD